MIAKKEFVIGIIAGFVVICLSGCATAKTKHIRENQQLRARIVQLESEIQTREEQRSQLETQFEDERRQRDALEAKLQKLGYVSKKGLMLKDFKSPGSVKKIQAALKNAGYDVGLIDGKIGKKTKQAIKNFQKEYNLKADGIVGKKTWAKLSVYLVE